jgi:hypothetical protein
MWQSLVRWETHVNLLRKREMKRLFGYTGPDEGIIINVILQQQCVNVLSGFSWLWGLFRC